ncbi:uncharacterized protein TNCV_2849091 [Trichonephila clavipes]|nr:uncharacterized protein TNCV_2849091 [Trichonephila clavipes]
MLQTSYLEERHVKSYSGLALEYFYTLSEDEEPIDICQLPLEESGCLTDAEDIDENTVQQILPANVCGKIEISTSIDNDKVSHEDMFDPEVPSTTKGMSNWKRKLKSNETNVELRRKKKDNLNQGATPEASERIVCSKLQDNILHRRLEEHGRYFMYIILQAQSPNLNPIENMWNGIERGIRQPDSVPSILKTLQSVILPIWSKTFHTTYQHLLDPIPRNIHAEIRVKDSPIVF